MAHNPRLGFRPSPAARAAAAREAAKAARADSSAGIREEAKELKVCGLAAVSARFARNPGSVQRLFFDQATAARVGPLCKALAAAKKVYRQVEVEELEKVAGSVHHGGVVAVVVPELIRVPQPADIAGWVKRGETLLLLDRVGNAHNLGALARTAAFFGVPRIIIPDNPKAARPNDAAYRVAEGGLEHVEVWQAKGLATFVRELVAAGYDVVGAATRGGRPDAPRAAGADVKPIALVLGNEEQGIAPDVLAVCSRLVTIPGTGKMESLNVSVAGAVLMWELVGRREKE